MSSNFCCKCWASDEGVGYRDDTRQDTTAKGRVERTNKTLQDRLVKALRLANVSSIDAANAFLPQFIEDFNQRFANPPRNNENLHRSVNQSTEELRVILSLQTTRKLTKNLTICYPGIEFQLQGYGKGYRLRHKEVIVCEHFDGDISLYCEGKQLAYKWFNKGQKNPPILCEKELDATMTNIKKKTKTNKSERMITSAKHS